MSSSTGGDEGGARDDPNRSSRGARQRLGPFWIEEPRWFWVLFALIVLIAVFLFGLALGFDPP